MWLGLALHRAGKSEEAAEAFARGLDLLPEQERYAYTDPTVLLTVEDSARVVELATGRAISPGPQVWAASDPLYLTDVNERWVEHIVRVTYADLKFAPTGGAIRGSRTDAGRIYVRYGPPRAVWSVVRDRSKEVDFLDMINAWRAWKICSDPQATPAECRGAEQLVRHTVQGGGRWVFWNYEPDRPNLVFTRDLEMSNLKFMDGSYSETYAGEIRARLPSAYQPFSLMLDVPHQLARFKGDAVDQAVVKTYAALPLSDLTGDVSDSVDVGTFFFDAGHRQSHRWRGRVSAASDTLVLNAQAELQAGEYAYAIEAYDRFANRVARARGQLVVPPYPTDTLMLSDLLVADAIDAGRKPTRSRDDLLIKGSPDLGFEAGEPVGLYWEVYGLTSEDGLARYQVTLDVQDAERRSLPVKVLDAIGGIFGGGDQERPQLTWTRDVVIEGRDRAVDWVMLGQLRDGEHRIVVTVHDLLSGATAESERSLRVHVPAEE